MNSMKTHSLFFLLFWMISHSMVAQKRQVVDGYPIANFMLIYQNYFCIYNYFIFKTLTILQT